MDTYIPYKSFINYLVTSNGVDYGQLHVFLLNTDNYTAFQPEDGETSVSMSSIDTFILNKQKIVGVKDSERQKSNSVIFDTSIDYADSEVDTETMSYEEALNIPCAKNYDKSNLLTTYLKRAISEYDFDNNSDSEDSLIKTVTTTTSVTRDEYYAGKRRETITETIVDSVGLLGKELNMKSEFDQDEYDRYGVETTRLNGDKVSVIGEKVVNFSPEGFVARGAIVGLVKSSNLIPIYFIKFNEPAYYNDYTFIWRTDGIFHLE